MPDRVSVIATVYNESASIDALIDSLRCQTRRRDEIVIVDGGSSDDTLARLERQRQRGDLPLRVWALPGCNISAGRNAAIAAAQGPIIAVVDAGVRLEDDWLETIIRPFAAASPPDVVSGFFVADPHTLFERALGAATSARRDQPRDLCAVLALRGLAAAPGRRSGVPRWLDYCEDLAFDFLLRDAGCRFVMQPDALVTLARAPRCAPSLAVLSLRPR